MTLIRACTLQDMAGLLALYRELRPHDPVLAPDAAHTALTTLLAQPHLHLLVAEVDGQLAATCQLGVVATLTNGAGRLAWWSTW